MRRIVNENSKSSNELGSKIIKGTGWNAIQLFISSAFKYIVQLILAYLIAPEAFGIIGMATVFTSIIDTLNDLGMGPALIQKKSEELTEAHYSTVFWLSLGFASVTFLIMAVLISPLIAIFYEESVLRPVAIVLCIPILLRPLTLIHRIKLTKAIDFKPIALIESVGAIIGGLTAIFLAFLGFGVWSIALQGIATALFTIPAMWKVVLWRPKRIFSISAFRETFNYGIFFMVKSLFATLMDNVDYLIIGKMMGSYSVGVYTFAFLMTDIIRKQIMGIMNKVMFPVYSKIQDQMDRVGAYYLSVIRYNTLIIIPLMAGMVVLAEPFVNILFNGKWADSIFPIQLLSVAVMFHVATGTFSTVLMGIGKAKDDFVIYFIKNVLVYLPLLLFFISHWGLNGAALAVLIHKAFCFMLNLILTKHYIKVKPTSILKNIAPSIAISLAILGGYFLLVCLLGNPSNLAQLILYGISLMFVYLLASYPFAKKEIMLILQWMSAKRRSGKI